MTGEHILIIHSDPKYAEALITDVLLPHGYSAHAASTGQAGLSTVQAQRPDLVLLDLSPDDMTYTETLQQLSVCGDPPVILLAPSGSEAHAVRAIRMEGRDVVIQPSKPKETAQAIARVLYLERLITERDELVSRLTAANEALERSLSEVQLLYHLGRAISPSLNLRDVLTAVVQAAISITHAEEGYLLLRDPDTDELYLRALQNLGERHVTIHCVQVDDCIARQVVHTGEPVSLSSEDHVSIKIECKESLGNTDCLARSLVNVPLQSQQQITGVIGAANVVSEKSFTQSDITLLSALADFAAMAINNAQLHTTTDQNASRAQVEVPAEQKRADLILRSITDGVFTVNRELCITSVNPAIERITGWQESELLGCRYDEIFAPQVDGRRLFAEQTFPGKALQTQSTVFSAWTTILRKDGHRIPVTGTAALLTAADSSVTGVLATMREVNLSQMRREMLDLLQSQGFQLNQLTEEALDILRLEPGTTLSHCHPITLRPIITQVVRIYQGMVPGNLFETKLPPDLPFAVGNEIQIELALVNLIDSVLEPGNLEQPVVISVHENDDCVIVAVEGPGSVIPTKQHEQPHQPFHLADKPSILLLDCLPWWKMPQIRLYIASKLIRAQGGRFWAENRSGTRTRYHFSLPKIEGENELQAFID